MSGLCSLPCCASYPCIRASLVAFLQRLSPRVPVGVESGGLRTQQLHVQSASNPPVPSPVATPPFSNACCHQVRGLPESVGGIVLLGVFATAALGIVTSSALQIPYVASLPAILQKLASGSHPLLSASHSPCPCNCIF